MSYRNGYDAAVARADALQLELTRLAAENASLRNASPIASPKPSRALGVLALAGGTLAVAATVFVTILATAGSADVRVASPPAAAAVEPVAAHSITLDELRSCARSLDSHPVLDTRAPDIAAVERTGAPCRSQLHDAARSTSLSLYKQGLVGAWADSEDQLANRISLIHEYYTTGVAAQESYATAPQLWSEYNVAVTSRDAIVTLALAEPGGEPFALALAPSNER